MRTELNARIGRTLPSPLFGLLVEPLGTGHAAHVGRGRWHRAWPRASWMPAALLLALWPHWVYVARRLVDGSDEPWGVLALVTVVGLLVRDRAQLMLPTRSALVACGVLAVVAAIADRVLPDLFAAAIAMLALGVFVMHALRRPAAAIIVLLLLTLPIIASLQFYLGYPLRLMVAHASAALLSIAGWHAEASGASILHEGITVLVDAPCAGIGMLWLGSYAAALLSYLNRASAPRTLVNGVVAALLVLIANIARNTLLFFPEAGLADWPAAAHEAIGLAAFAGAIVPLTLFASWRKH
jgi:exosortase/archaeosortase family protein